MILFKLSINYGGLTQQTKLFIFEAFKNGVILDIVCLSGSSWRQLGKLYLDTCVLMNVILNRFLLVFTVNFAIILIDIGLL